MQYVIAVFSALLPAFFLVGYVWFRDKNKREPIREVLRGVWNGVLSIVLALIIVTPCTWLQQFLPFFAEGNVIWGAVGTAFLSAAIPEEIAKFVMFRSLVKENRYFDERMDGIVYAAAVSMGFAGVENVLYLLDNLDALLGVGLIRALFSVPGLFFLPFSRATSTPLLASVTSAEKSLTMFWLCWCLYFFMEFSTLSCLLCRILRQLGCSLPSSCSWHSIYG